MEVKSRLDDYFILSLLYSPLVGTRNGFVAGGGDLGSTNGVGTNAKFYSPTDNVLDSVGNMYVTDSTYGLVRKIDMTGLPFEMYFVLID